MTEDDKCGFFSGPLCTGIKIAILSVCSKFSHLSFCQLLFELVYNWESYHRIKMVNFLLRHRVLLHNSKLIYKEIHYLSHFKLNSLKFIFSLFQSCANTHHFVYYLSISDVQTKHQTEHYISKSLIKAHATIVQPVKFPNNIFRADVQYVCTRVQKQKLFHLSSIGVDLAGLLGGTHGQRRRWVRVEWDGIWGGVSPLQPTKGSGGAS